MFIISDIESDIDLLPTEGEKERSECNGPNTHALKQSEVH